MRSLEDVARVDHALARIGGAECTRRFQLGDREVRRGETLSKAELLRIPKTNLAALASNGFLSLKLEPPTQRKEKPHVRPGTRTSRRKNAKK
jgi:hypothetical protein